MNPDLLATGPLVALARSDLARMRLPDGLTLPLVAAGLALAAVRAGGWPLDALAGAAAGWLLVVGLRALWMAWRGRDAIGMGDAKLLAAAGAWVGWAPLPRVILVASLGALAAAVLRGHDRAAPLPFGPWLCAGFAALWLWGLATGGLPR